MVVSFFGKGFRRARGLRAIASTRVNPETIDHVVDALLQAGFSPLAYRSAHDDLASALDDDRASAMHFVAYCGEDTRPFPMSLSLDGLRRLFELRAPSHFKASVAVAVLNSVCTALSPIWSAPMSAQCAFWSDLLAILRLAGTPYFVIGDSHSNLYRRIVPTEDRLFIPVHILCLASSAIGLSNPNSRSGAGSRLTQLATALKQVTDPSQIQMLFKFGQVDVEFVFNFDRIRNQRPEFREDEFHSFCQRSIDSYIEFVSTRFSANYVNVVSVFPPALSDAAWRDGYTNAHIVDVESSQRLDEIVAGVRNLEIPALPERTRLSALYNRLLEKKTVQTKLRFLNDFPYFLGRDRVLDPIFVPNHKGADHHLEQKPTAPIIDRLIAKQLTL